MRTPEPASSGAARTVLVFLRDEFRLAIQAEGQSPERFAEVFKSWREDILARGEEGEYSSFYFGKDGAYEIDGSYDLRHAHLVPSDEKQLVKWAKLHKRRSRKTSDRILVYAKDGAFRYLLIDLFPEPEGHSTADDKELMRELLTIAQDFISSR